MVINKSILFLWSTWTLNKIKMNWDFKCFHGTRLRAHKKILEVFWKEQPEMVTMLICSLKQELLLLEESGELLTQKVKSKNSTHTTTKLFKLKMHSNKLLVDGKLFTILEMKWKHQQKKNSSHKKKMLSSFYFHGTRLKAHKKMLEVYSREQLEMELMLTNLLKQELLLLVDFGDLLTQKAKRKTLILTTTKLLNIKIKSKEQQVDGKLFTILEMKWKHQLEVNSSHKKKMLSSFYFHGTRLKLIKKT